MAGHSVIYVNTDRKVNSSVPRRKRTRGASLLQAPNRSPSFLFTWTTSNGVNRALSFTFSKTFNDSIGWQRVRITIRHYKQSFSLVTDRFKIVLPAVRIEIVRVPDVEGTSPTVQPRLRRSRPTIAIIR